MPLVYGVAEQTAAFAFDTFGFELVLFCLLLCLSVFHGVNTLVKQFVKLQHFPTSFLECDELIGTNVDNQS